MRKKKLLTAMLCTVLAIASLTVSSVVKNTDLDAAKIVWAAETAEEPGADKTGAEKADKGQTPSLAAETSAAPTAETSAQPQTPSTEVSAQPQTPATEASTQPQTPSTEASTPPAGDGSSDTPMTEGGETQLPSETVPEGGETGDSGTSGEESGSEAGTEHGTEHGSDQTSEPTSEPTSDHTGTAEGTEQGTESVSEGISEAGTETVTEAGSEQEKESETESETEEETEEETSKYASNEELIAHQNIVTPPEISLEFRFTQVEKVYAVVSNPDGSDIYEEKSTDARAAGTMEYYGSCYVLEDTEDGWLYVESGNVRGFVKAEDVVTDEVAQRIVNVKGLDSLPQARLLLARTENKAFTYTHTTVQDVLAEKVYALADREEVRIYEKRKTNAAVTGILSKGELCYILADEEKEWVFVESGNVRGFVQKSELLTGNEADRTVSETGERNMPLAELLIEPEDNSACYYTLTSVKAASQAAITREALVKFALQFVGNPYVWGGTSLTSGADCSGFVQSVYAQFGYALPRVAEHQAVYGMQIPISSAEPGDLIFYAKKGSVYHVSIYLGDGKVVQAANENVGIITSGIGGDAVWATRVIAD